jgi:hypothetical protein
MSYFSQHQHPWRPLCGWRCGGWLSLLLLLAVSPTAHASLFTLEQAHPSVADGEAADASSARPPREGEDPRVIFAQAQAWPAQGAPFPDAVLRQAVETALRPEAPWDQVTAAIAAFDLYHDRPWVTQVMQPYVVCHAASILVNADFLVRIQRAWTIRAVAMAAPQAPGLVLSVLTTLSAIDPVWAKQLATTAAATMPAAVWPHVDTLLAVDVQWAEGILRQATPSVAPYDAIRAVRSYSMAPWGPQFFAEVVLREPRWVVSALTYSPEQYEAVRHALDAATHPAVQALAALARSRYPAETKERMATFVEELAAQTLSFEEAAHLSSDAQAYFRMLVTLYLRDPAGEHHAIATTLAEEALTLVLELNSLFEHPAAVRFRAVEHLAARELYLVLTYGEAEMFTSSYRGVFDRLLARMQQERLTGDQLLTSVHYRHVRVFIKAAAVFERLTAFLATIPSPVARWSLLTRCLSDLERTTDVTVQAVMAAEILSAPLDRESVRLIRDTLRSEYRRVEMEHHQQGRLIYGLLIAALIQRHASALADPALMALAEPYLPALPDLTDIPVSTLFHQSVSIHRYFFYNDEDGKQSFHSFLAQYHADRSWHIEDHGSFVHLRSQGPGRQIEISANTFTDDEQGITDIDQALRTRQIAPSVIVHRGHSTHVDRTLEKLPATAALVYLGNCGGNTLLDTVLRHAPTAHIITTRGIGTSTINDPLLKAFNTYLLRGKDLTWQHFWQHLAATLGRHARFMDYVPPDKNVSVVFLRAYHRLTAAAKPAVARAQ